MSNTFSPVCPRAPEILLQNCSHGYSIRFFGSFIPLAQVVLSTEEPVIGWQSVNKKTHLVCNVALFANCSLWLRRPVVAPFPFKQAGVEQNSRSILSAPPSLSTSHFPHWSPLHLPLPTQMSALTSSAIKGSTVAAGSTQTWLFPSRHPASHEKMRTKTQRRERKGKGNWNTRWLGWANMHVVIDFLQLFAQQLEKHETIKVSPVQYARFKSSPLSPDYFYYRRRVIGIKEVLTQTKTKTSTLYSNI